MKSTPSGMVSVEDYDAMMMMSSQQATKFQAAPNQERIKGFFSFVEGPPAVEINYVPPRPPGMIRLSTTIMRSDNPLGPWTDVTNLQTIELAADANQGFYRSRMDVK